MKVLETCVYARNLEAVRDLYEQIMGLECLAFKPPRQTAGGPIDWAHPSGGVVRLWHRLE